MHLLTIVVKQTKRNSYIMVFLGYRNSACDYVNNVVIRLPRKTDTTEVSLERLEVEVSAVVLERSARPEPAKTGATGRK